MKTLLKAIASAFLLPIYLLAEPANPAPPTGGELIKDNSQIEYIKADEQLPRAAMLLKSSPEFLPGSIFDTLNIYRYSNHAVTGQCYNLNSIVYEPETNSVLFISPDWNRSSGKFEDACIKTAVYTNAGKTYQGIYDRAVRVNDGMLGVLGFDVLNTIPGNTDPLRLNMFVTAYNYPGPSGTTSNGGGFYFFDPTDNTDSPFEKFIYKYGPTADYAWSKLTPLGILDAKNHYAWYIAGNALFASDESGATNGRYSFLGAENLSDHDIYLNQFSTELTPNKFKENTLEGMYNSQIYFDKDANGTVYGIINNIYSENYSRRFPAVTISDDFGYSWSELDKMPWEVIDNFVLGLTDGKYTAEETSFGFYAYTSAGFVVTAPGEFSYLCQYYCYDSQTNNTYGCGVAEIFKKNGSWGMREVESMKYFDSNPNKNRYVSSLNMVLNLGTVNGAEDQIVYESNYRGYEIELSKTANGEYLVAKWIEKKYTIDPEHPDAKTDALTEISLGNDSCKVNYKSGDEWKSMYLKSYTPMNVYVKYRKVNEDKWSEAFNLTDDENFHCNTHIPRILPNFSDNEKLIPLQTTVARNFDDSEQMQNHVLYSLPVQLRGMAYRLYRRIIYGCKNIAGEVNSINDNNLCKINIFPNPANSEFTVKTGTDGLNIVEIYSILGEKLMEKSGVQSEFSLNADALPGGVYIVRVTNQGNITSSLLTVTK